MAGLFRVRWSVLGCWEMLGAKENKDCNRSMAAGITHRHVHEEKKSAK